MNASILHRGPDDSGLYVDGPTGLAMRRLSIIDLETGSQPIFNEDRSIAVVFNGEIYNFAELRARLTRQGHHFETNGDTEVIVHLYEQYGDEFVDQLNGMFALAIWDRTAQRLLLARDRLGQKPLYYSRTADGLIFGSELKCLLQCDDVSDDLDRASIYHYFTLGYVPHPATIYRHVSQLEPAHTLIFENGSLRIDRYWELPSRVERGREMQDVQCELRELLEDATRLRMIADVPLGAFLSGGLDSSIVVALMARQASAPIKTYHIDFGEPKFSEVGFARQVANRYGTDHHELVVRPAALEVFDELVSAFDEPFGDTSALPTYYVSQLARQHVTVAVAGDGGDESFGGYRSYERALARRRFPRGIRASLGTAGRWLHTCLPRSAPGRRFFRSLGMSAGQHFAVGTAELETRELLSRDFLRSLNGASTFGLLDGDLRAGDRTDRLAPFTYLDTQRYLPDDILTKVDRMSMAHSLEVRSPFLDHRVFELAARIPYDWKIRRGATKRILKEAFAADLPPDVLLPRKRGFSVPMAQWLRGELRGALEEGLADTAMAEAGIFHLAELRELADEHWLGRRDRSDQLWRYLFFVRWWHSRSRRPSFAGC